jgi:hypothetical protein
MAQVLQYGFLFVDKELLLGFEVAELQHEMRRHREGICRNRFPFDGAQIEIEPPLFIGEAR